MLKIFASIGLMIFSWMSIDNEILSLSDFRWKNRIIIINSDVDKIESTKQIKHLMKDTEGLQERNLLVFYFGEDEAQELVNEETYKIANQQKSNLNLTKDSFEIVLIGKDGGIKFRESSVVQNSDIYRIIDRMPMRQAEMRRNKK